MNENNMRFFGFETLSELLQNVYRNREQQEEFHVEIVTPMIQSEDILSHPYLLNMVCQSDSREHLQELVNTDFPKLEYQTILQNVHIFLLDRIQTYPGKIIPIFTTMHSEADLFLRCLRHDPNPPTLCIAGCRMNVFDNDLHFGCLVHVKRGFLNEENHRIRLGVLLECVQPCEVLKYSRNRDRATLGSVRLFPFSLQPQREDGASLIDVFSQQCAQMELSCPCLLRSDAAIRRV